MVIEAELEKRLRDADAYAALAVQEQQRLEEENARLRGSLSNAAMAAEHADKDAGQAHARLTVVVEDLAGALKGLLKQVAGTQYPDAPARMRPAIAYAQQVLASGGWQA